MTFPRIVIAGCGNPLFADDGFGPAVAEELWHYKMPDTVLVVDAGTSGPQFLFPMLDPKVTKKLILIDCADFGERPGTLIRLGRDDLYQTCFHDRHTGGIFSGLNAIRDMFDITIIGCQPGNVSEPFMEIGLSEEVEKAIPSVTRIILDYIRRNGDTAASENQYINGGQPVGSSPGCRVLVPI